MRSTVSVSKYCIIFPEWLLGQQKNLQKKRKWLGLQSPQKSLSKGIFKVKKFIRVIYLENPANNLLLNDTLTTCCRVQETKSETEECDYLI